MTNNEIQVIRGIYEGGEIRTLNIDGNLWFVAKDVCTYFGDTNYRRSIKNVEPENKGVSQVMTKGGMQNMLIVNEAGLYDLCFQMRPERARHVTEEYIKNRQAKLKCFCHWVTHDVLPSIRKYGYYVLPPVAELSKTDPENFIQLLKFSAAL